MVTICPGKSHEQLLGWSTRLGGIKFEPLSPACDGNDAAEDAVDPARGRASSRDCWSRSVSYSSTGRGEWRRLISARIVFWGEAPPEHRRLDITRDEQSWTPRRKLDARRYPFDCRLS